MSYPDHTVATGVVERHCRWCAARREAECDCAPSFAAWIWSSLQGRKVWRTFGDVEDAVAWRQTMRTANTAANPVTQLREFADVLISTQRRTLGEPLPHLMVARDHLRRLEKIAQRDGESLWAGLTRRV